MSGAVSDLQQLLRGLRPLLNDGVYVFASVAADADLAGIPLVATFRETEGLTVIVAEADARHAGIAPLFRCAWITLRVHSDLAAVGLTAAVAQALGAAGISCNVVAAAFHDHVFVPCDRAQDAMARLQALQRQAMAAAR